MNAMRLLEAMTNIDNAVIENAAVKPKRPGRTVTRVLLLAALITALAMTAFATVEAVNWFKDYFAKWSAEELTTNQITFIEENTIDLTQSQTCNGYTITVESTFSDGVNGFIKLKLTAPEEIKLDAVNYFPGNDEALTSQEGTGEAISMGMGWGKIDDGDGRDNTVGILCRLYGFVENRTQWKLRIEELHGTYEENIGKPSYRQWTELLAEGTWEFPIVFSDDGFREIELIKDPIPSEVNIGLNKDSYHDVRITSFKLRAMSAEITYEYVVPVHGAGDFDPIYVVMKDGSQIMLLPKSGSPTSSTYYFAAPVILSDADHVLLPDGTQLPV